jgi:FkbM family methyltransferase
LKDPGSLSSGKQAKLFGNRGLAISKSNSTIMDIPSDITLETLTKNTGKKEMQKVYEDLLVLALRGLNIGSGGNFRESGEMNIPKFIETKLGYGTPLTIFDVGANVGNYSKTLSGYFGERATIHSFEPSLKTFNRLLENIAGYKLIIPVNMGCSDREHDVTLYTNNDLSGLASVYRRRLEHFGMFMNKSERIKVTTIDQYCYANKIDRINFLKLDIEGHELSAIHGAKDMIENSKVDFIQFEFGGSNIDSKTFFQEFYYFFRNKFRLYRILKNGLYEIRQYREIYELFMTTNYLAEAIR